jgi:phospholipase/carboxylesterase
MSSDPLLVKSGPAYDQTGLVHRVYRPPGNGRHPTVVMLHGYLGNEDVMWIFGKAVPPPWLKLAPRGLERLAADSYSWSRIPQSGWPEMDDFAAAVSALTGFIDALPDLYQADPKQIYLMGFSQGAALAWAAAFAQPRLTQGIAGLVGFMPALPNGAAVDPQHWAGLPVFMATGLNDETMPLKVARRSADAIRNLGAELAYHEYDTGHKLDAAGMSDLRQWWRRRLDDR